MDDKFVPPDTGLLGLLYRRPAAFHDALEPCSVLTKCIIAFSLYVQSFTYIIIFCILLYLFLGEDNSKGWIIFYCCTEKIGLASFLFLLTQKNKIKEDNTVGIGKRKIN
jgi:hypothetical protein